MKFVSIVLFMSFVCLLCLPVLSSNALAIQPSSGVHPGDALLPFQAPANQTVSISLEVNQTLTYQSCDIGSALNFTYTLNSTMHVGIYVSMTSLVNYDLYVKWDGTQPNLTNYDQVSLANGTTLDNVSKRGLPPGSYYLMVYHRSDWPGMNDNWFNVTVFGYYPIHNMNTGLSYPTIQEAIDANETLSGHTILVDEGTFIENVSVDKAVSLVGGADGTTVLDGGQIGIVANGVNVTGFTVTASPSSGVWLNHVQNCSIVGNNVTSNFYGIYIYPLSNWNSVTGNYFANNQEGVYVDSSSNENLSGNTFVNDGMLLENSFGNSVNANLVNGEPLVYVEGASDKTVSEAGQVILVNCTRMSVENLDISNTTQAVELWTTTLTNVTGNNMTNSYGGILLGSSTNNNVEGNSIANNHDYGIGAVNSSYNVISANTVQANLRGIEFENSSKSTVNENNVLANEFGISLEQGSSYNTITENDVEGNVQGLVLYSSNNFIYHNDFANTKQAVASSASSNFMDNGYPSGGNYWGDYNGSDAYSGVYQNETGYDWIGDTPYVIDQNNIDRYPLTQPFVAKTEEIRIAYRGLLLEFEALQFALENLNSTTNALTANVTVLQAKADFLNSAVIYMQTEINSLNSTDANLQQALNSLTDNQTDVNLSQTLASLQEQLNLLNLTLQASINKLQDQNNAQNSQTNTVTNQLYILAVVIVILIVATVYLVIRRPRTRLEGEKPPVLAVHIHGQGFHAVARAPRCQAHEKPLRNALVYFSGSLSHNSLAFG